ncbi:MAG: DUF1801 domain-containing protein [Bacteroidota bacterium]
MNNLPTPTRPLPDLIESGLQLKDISLVELFISVRNLVLHLAPDCIELAYDTHALTSVFSHSPKLSEAFCHLPVYKSHLNLGFNKGALLNDPEQRLKGTGKLIRHIPVSSIEDVENTYVKSLIKQAVSISE